MTQPDFSHLTPKQRSLCDLVGSIPSGRWCSYGDVGEALAELGVVDHSTNRGALGRGAASIEDGLRMANMRRGIPMDIEHPTRQTALDTHGYPWWRVRQDDGRLVYGGTGRDRQVVDDNFSLGNVWLREEGGEVVGGGYASQGTRFDLAATVRAPVESEALCMDCFMRPCQCDADA